MILACFIFFLLAFVLVGMLSVLSSRREVADYLVASRSIPAWLTGLSAVATLNSGFMFIGMIGVTYTTGLNSVWLMIGWVGGDLAVSLFCLRKLKRVADRVNATSMGMLLAEWQGGNFRGLRRLGGAFTLLFLTAYAAAQFKAGGKALTSLFDWHPYAGVFIGAAIVLLYCISGGIRASIWTDAAQSFVMLFGMTLLLVFGYSAFGEDRGNLLAALPADYFTLFPPGKGAWGAGLFIAGWVFGGVGAIGQPHIITRFFAMKSEREIRVMRCYYYLWYTIFYAATICVGLLCRVLMPDINAFDAEQALPRLSMLLLHPVGSGLILAAIFAASMSTADSLVLACSASLTSDFELNRNHSLARSKHFTVAVVALAVGIALIDSQSIFMLVIMAWGLLGAAFAPLIIIFCAGKPVSEHTAIILMLTGVATYGVWHFNPVLSGWIYGIAPAIALPCSYLILRSKK